MLIRKKMYPCMCTSVCVCVLQCSLRLLMICIAVIKGFGQPKATGSEINVPADKMMLPGAKLLAEKNLLADMGSIKSLKQSEMTGVFTVQAVSIISSIMSPIFSL